MATFNLLIAITILTLLSLFSPTSSTDTTFTPAFIEYLTPSHLTHLTHTRHKRSHLIPPSGKIDHEVKFEALGRKFHMLLHEREDIITPNFKVSLIDNGGKAQVFHHDLLNKFYHGHLAGHREAKVAASIDPHNQVMTGFINDRENDLMYYIEPAKNLPNANQLNVTDDTMAVYTYDEKQQLSNFSAKFCDSINLKDDPQFKSPVDEKGRFSRSVDDSPHAENLLFKRPNRCGMRIVADTSFFRNMKYKVKDTVNYVISVIDRINSIYLHTNFGDTSDSELQGFGFVIQEVQVYSNYSDDADHYNSNKTEATINQLLDKFSQDKTHKWFCLSHLFTHTRFSEGVLGLAYVANPRKAVPGGICSGKVLRNGKEYYYNTGVTSTKNSYGKPIYTRITDLITAHELGHNWGAEHDPDLKECSPSSSDGGPYLMHTYSLSGNEINNKLFSPCSKRSIASVLNFRSPVCFQSDSKNICGNGVVDENEECDAGHISNAQTPDSGGGDDCCTLECKLRPHAVCSDINHLCCDQCKIRANGDLCREANPETCKDATVCDGKSRDCPANSRFYPDGSPCLDGGTCSQGQCKSICEQEGKIACICHLNEKNYCKRCCRENSSNSTCRPHSSRLDLPDGSPCIYGFCQRGRCKRAPQDVVKRLWEIIRSSSLNSFLRLMLDNLVFVTVIGVLMFYIPFAYWINSQDRETKQKIHNLHRSRATNAAGDTWEMTRLHDEQSNDPPSRYVHHYNLRSGRGDVPDEVDAPQEKINRTHVDLEPAEKLDTTD